MLSWTEEEEEGWKRGYDTEYTVEHTDGKVLIFDPEEGLFVYEFEASEEEYEEIFG